DGPIAVQELPATLGVAETFGEWKGRCEPRDCFRHVGVVEHGYYGGTWCRAVLLQHKIGGYQRFPGRLTRLKISDRWRERAWLRVRGCSYHTLASERPAVRCIAWLGLLRHSDSDPTKLASGVSSNKAMNSRS